MASPTDDNQQGRIDRGYKDGFNNSRSAYSSANLSEHESQSAKVSESSDDIGEKEKKPEWNTSVTPRGGEQNSKKNTKRKLQIPHGKKLALGGGIAGIILGIVFTMFFSASMLIVNMAEQIKEKITGSTASVMQVKTGMLYRYKLTGDITSGSCSVVTIRCKFKSMSDRQIQRLQKAGITVVDDGKSLVPGRKKVARFEFEGRTISADNLAKELKDPKFASSMNKAMNPRFHAFASSAAKKTFNKLGVTKSKNLKPRRTKTEMSASLRENLSGRTAALEFMNLEPAGTDGQGNQLYKDPNNPGQTITGAEADDMLQKGNSQYTKALEEKKSLLDTGKNMGGKITASAIKGTLLVGAGLADSTCTGYMIVRTASFAAKYLGALQMIRYSNTFLNTADAIKAGDATPEEVTYLNDILTSKNIEGKTAMDSRGWNYTMYGDVTPIPEVGKGANPDDLDKTSRDAILASEVTNYINGQSTSNNVMGQLAKKVDSGGGSVAAADATCGFIKSTTGQAIIIGVGVAALAGCVATFLLGVGAGCLTGNVALQAGIAATLAVTMAVLSPWLISLATDSILTGNENGNEAGNAIVSGAGALNSHVGVASGLSYLTPDSASEFAVVNKSTSDMFAMIDRNDSSPFDVTNPHTFAGIFASHIYTAFGKHNNTSVLANGLSSLSSLVKLPATMLSKPAYATYYGDAGVCPDPDYSGLATDINCNPLVGQDNETLYADIDTVMNYMENTHINPETGDAKSKEFKNYLKYCVNREGAIGSFEEGEDASDEAKGLKCGNNLSGSEKKMYSMFRAYQSLLVTNEGLDV